MLDNRHPVEDEEPFDPTDMDEALAEYNAATRAAGITEAEPTFRLWRALGSVLLALVGLARHITLERERVTLDAREAARAEAARSKAVMASIAAETVQSVSMALSEAVKNSIVNRDRRLDRIQMLTMTGTLVFSVAVAGIGGYFYGRMTRDREMVETSAGLQKAIGGSGLAADRWRLLIENNNILDVEAAETTRRSASRSGRPWELVAFWTGPPKQAVANGQ